MTPMSEGEEHEQRLWKNTIKIYCNENVDIKMSAHDAFLE
jgi:hypothetical protein